MVKPSYATEMQKFSSWTIRWLFNLPGLEIAQALETRAMNLMVVKMRRKQFKWNKNSLVCFHFPFEGGEVKKILKDWNKISCTEIARVRIKGLAQNRKYFQHNNWDYISSKFCFGEITAPKFFCLYLIVV